LGDGRGKIPAIIWHGKAEYSWDRYRNGKDLKAGQTTGKLAEVAEALKYPVSQEFDLITRMIGQRYYQMAG